jgi:single-stranded-DNA-specific exonuclease RecJ
LARLLLNRGLRDPEQARVFLYGGLADLSSPFSLPGIERAAAVLTEAVEKKRKILVYGDYDVDGLTAAAILFLFFSRLGSEVGCYIPDRLSEGYGLNQEALAKALKEGYQVVLTVDCGVASREEVEWARAEGLTVVITDHHRVPPIPPPADAVVVPPPGQSLAGAGVAFQVVRALEERMKISLSYSLVDLAALGTIGDSVPLVGDSRIIVRHGLAQLASGKRPGLAALAQTSGLADRTFDPRTVSFTLVPRLNAAGRLGNPLPALQLLLTNSEEEAARLAVLLERLNQERQAIESRILAEARELVEQEARDSEAVILLASPSWHYGVVGIVAGRLAEEYSRPVILLAVEGEEARGSGRGVPGCSLYNLLAPCLDLLTRFGGHDQAVGLSLPLKNLPALRNRLAQSPRGTSLAAAAPSPLYLEGVLGLAEIGEDLVEEIRSLEPYGEGNDPPLFVTRGLKITEAKSVGKEGRHLRLVVEAEGAKKVALAFGMGSVAAELIGRRVDLAFTPVLEVYNGTEAVELRVADLRPEPPLGIGAMGRSSSEVSSTARAFFGLWSRLARYFDGESGNCAVAVPTASLSGRLAMWLRELGLPAVRLGVALRRRQVEQLAERLGQAKGCFLVSTAGFLSQHASLLEPVCAFAVALLLPETPPGFELPFFTRAKVHLPGAPRGLPVYRLSFAGLKTIVRRGTRLVAYVRRPEKVREVAARLEGAGGGRVGIYHQDLSPAAKKAALQRWREGYWTVLVGTPALAAVKGAEEEETEVAVLYPPFSLSELSLLSLGAGCVYLCWPRSEEEINERLLRSLWPPPAFWRRLAEGENLTALASLDPLALQVAAAVLEELGGKEGISASWRYQEFRRAWQGWKELQEYTIHLPFVHT